MKTQATLATGMLCLLLFHAGCATTEPDREARMGRGYVYYLDGASGGAPLHNWSGGVRQGLLDAGYDGAGEMFTWQTGLGLVADQTASNQYKRGKAGELAGKMQQYHRDHPNAPLTLMGLSAGTAIAVFTLEALPANVMVANAILLSGSLSADHDLTRALRRVRGKLYVFTSQNDAVLQVLMPFGGTADRGSGTTATVGVEGARVPAGASAETRRLYASKVVEIPWNQQFAAYGHRGGHTDSVKAPFVQHFVAPLVPSISAPQVAAARTRPGPGQVENPDYRRWARFAPGSWVMFEGYQVIEGIRQPLRVKASLVSKNEHALVVERRFIQAGGTGETMPLPRRLFVTAVIDPKTHPMTHPDAKIQSRPNARVKIGSREFHCEVKTVSVAGYFAAWGSNVRGVAHLNPDIPGGMARLALATRMDGKQMEVAGNVIEYHVAKEQ